MRTIAIMLFLVAASSLSALAQTDPAPAKAVHPVVCVDWHGLVLGGTVDGRWEESYDVAPLLRGGEKYRLYRLREHLGAATGGRPEELTDGYHGFGVKVEPAPENAAGVFAIGGAWDALPRLPKLLSTSQPVYIDAVASFLKEKGIVAPQPHLTQVIRTDLDGDGTDEVLVCATNAEPHRIFFEPARGDYSLAILRKLVGDRVETIELGGYYCLEQPPHESPPLGEVLTISAVLDLNGDGVMEVLLHNEVYEGEGIRALEVRGNMIKEAFWDGRGA